MTQRPVLRLDILIKGKTFVDNVDKRRIVDFKNINLPYWQKATTKSFT
jgi:hypothetical protein